jgi:hypothetical protein
MLSGILAVGLAAGHATGGRAVLVAEDEGIAVIEIVLIALLLCFVSWLLGGIALAWQAADNHGH